ncbi:hypothetical protein RU97_GL001855 [Enterococcus canis]|uniref:HTH cro/C1-type domain-containing protein n=1 Tax=Enterococcus canis TaxID=214095 RepID=A0A1L8RFB4_9ENTE|nr:helix-turn-helix transcriptional regulator [Enterococcus canis]OJG18458.1 hypothetical protein RU97_GL001855 [Enterococcus canis]
MLGHKIKELRQTHQLSQDELAKELYVTRQTISRWENEKSIPSSDSINSLANLFNIDVAELFSYTNQNNLAATPLVDSSTLHEPSKKERPILTLSQKYLSFYNILLIVSSLASFFHLYLTPFSFYAVIMAKKKNSSIKHLIYLIFLGVSVHLFFQILSLITFYFNIGTHTTEIIIK